MFLISASSLPNRMRSEDRYCVAVTESLERCGVTQRPIDPLDTVQSRERDRFGRLHLHPRCPRSGGLDRHTLAPSQSAKNSAPAAFVGAGWRADASTGRGVK